MLAGRLRRSYVPSSRTRDRRLHNKNIGSSFSGRSEESIRYVKNHQNEDGGFGLHIEGPSCMFETSLK